MTIAACYLSPEGVVLGADSTSTVWVTGPDGASGAFHHLNYAQKIFEVGENSTLGVTMWGMGNIGEMAHRTLIAQFSDVLIDKKLDSMEVIASRFSDAFWHEYSVRFENWLTRFRELAQKKSEGGHSEDESGEFGSLLEMLSGGFCIGGRLRWPTNGGHRVV